MDSKFLYLNSVDPTKITCKIKEKFSKLTLSSKKKLTETINNDKDENKDLINHASRNLDYKLLTDDDSDNGVGFLNKLLRSETTEDTNQSAKSIEKSIFSEKLQISDSDDTFCSMEGENIQKDELKLNATSLIPEGQTTLTNMLDNKIAKSNNSNRPFDTVSSIPNSIKLKVLTEDVQSNDRESSQIVSTTSLRKSSCYKSSPEFLVGTTDDRISINKSLIVISSTEASPCRNSVNISDNTSGYDKTEEVIILTDSEEETDVSIGQYQRHVSENLSIDKFELGTTLTRVKAERIQKFLKDVQANQIRIANAETESMTGSVSDKVSNIQLKQPNVHIASDETQSMHESVFEKAVESLTDITGTKINVPEKKPIHGASYKQIAEQDTESMQSSMVMTEQNKNANQSLHTSSSVPDESLTIAETSSENENYENHVPLNSSTSDSKFPTNSQTIWNTNTNNDELSNQIQISESIENAETSEVDQISDRIRNINISAKINIKIQITGQFEEDSSSSLEDNEISGRDSKRTSLQSADNYNSCSSAHENIQSESIKTPKLPKFSQKPDIVHCPLILSSNPKEICNVTPDKTKIVQNESPLNDSSSKNNTSACTPKQTKINKDIVNDEYLKTANDLLTKLYGETWKTPDIIKTLKKQSNSGKKTPENKYDESILDDFSMFQKNIPNNLESTRLGQTFKRPPIKPINDIKSRSLKKTINKKFNSNLMENNGLENTTKFTVTKNGRRVKPRFQNITASETESEEISDNSFSIETDSESSLELGLGGKTTTRRGKRTTKKNPNHNKFVLLDLTNDEIKVVKRMDKTPPVKGDYLQKLLDSCTYEKPNMVSTPTTVRTKRKLFTPRFGSEDEVVPVDSPRKPYLSSSDEEKENVKLIAPLPFNFHLINKNLESVRTGQPIFKLSTPKSDSKKNTVQKETPIKNKPTELTTSNSPAKRGNRVIEKIADTPENKYGFLKSLDVCVSKSLCHPDALFYRDNYRQKKVELADKLYEIYNTMCFKNELNVPLAWNKKLLNTAGRCTNKRKGNLRFSVVELSEKVLTSADRLRCTLIHELCHAATWIFNGEHGHGATWKSWACKANQTFPELPKIGVCHQYDIEYKYTYKCTLCGARSHAHSKSKKVENIRCTCCHGTIEIFLNKKDKTGNIVQTPVKSPKAFAKFVKEKYRDFKGPNVKHSEVMKLLSAAYAEINLEEKKND